MSDHAESRDPAIAAAEAVKAYVRLNRTNLTADGELLSLLLPDRFDSTDVGDIQRYIIERMRSENTALRAERDSLLIGRDKAARLGDGVRKAVLDLLDARSFEEAIEVATGAASVFGAQRAALCVESGSGVHATGTDGVRLIAQGTAAAVLGSEGSGAILSGGGEMLLGKGGSACKSVAVFRLRIGRDTPAALYALGAAEEGAFEGDEIAADLGFFARALERAIRAWLDLPKI